MTFAWSDYDASSYNGLIGCGSKVWTVTDGAGGAIDSTVFTNNLLAVVPTNTIDIYTTDIAKAATYNIEVKVQYDTNPTSVD